MLVPHKFKRAFTPALASLREESLNFVINKKWSAEGGFNYTHLTFNSVHLVPHIKFSNIGLYVPFTYATKYLIFELSYLQGLKSFYPPDNYLEVKPISGVSLSFSYLFNTNFSFGKKGINCPRF